MKQDSKNLSFQITWPDAHVATDSGSSIRPDDTVDFIKNYFNLQLNLSALYEKWSRDDINFRVKAPRFSGVRILNQDAWETLVCFICSSNNNISRISQMAQKLCMHYGQFIGSIGGEKFYDFPSPQELAAPGVEKHLRQLGFGYRAKYIAATARCIATEKPPNWLTGLRNVDCPQWPSAQLTVHNSSAYKDAHDSLLPLSGVGPKVADCVCLMGLGWSEAVPVDTHVWQIAARDYKFKGTKSKTLSLAMYHDIGNFFRGIWGKHAGWAQSVLFTANLRAFSDRLEASPLAGYDTNPSTTGGKKRKLNIHPEE